MRKKSKELGFEINLLPIISLLAVCICFLLLTTIWINLGEMRFSQSYGGQSVAETEKPKGSLWVRLSANKDISVRLKNAPASLRKFNRAFFAGEGSFKWNEFNRFLEKLQETELIETAHIVPVAGTKYDDLVSAMDLLKKVQVKNIGIDPL